jgi:hypothetical protein
MIDINPIIQRINALLEEGTEQSITYAALEARLALEKVCYDRLRQAHDYISNAQLRRWQPRDVVNLLISDVDQHVATTRTFYISKGPAVPGVQPADDDWVEMGTEVGFDPKRIGVMWNALSGLALHVTLPKDKNDHIPAYGDKKKIRKKVEEVRGELEQLSTTTMAFSGIGPEVSFICSCGEKNRRRAALLRDGQVVHCVNPDCKITWKAIEKEKGFVFEAVTVPVNCEKCKAINHMPWRFFLDMRHDQVGSFSCHSCEHKNFVQWRLMQVRPDKLATATDSQG